MYQLLLKSDKEVPLFFNLFHLHLLERTGVSFLLKSLILELPGWVVGLVHWFWMSCKSTDVMFVGSLCDVFVVNIKSSIVVSWSCLDVIVCNVALTPLSVTEVWSVVVWSQSGKPTSHGNRTEPCLYPSPASTIWTLFNCVCNSNVVYWNAPPPTKYHTG